MAGWRRVVLAKDEEPGEVAGIIFYLACHYLHSIDFGCPHAGDSSAVNYSLLLNHLNTTGGVIGRYQFTIQVLEKRTALPQCLRVGVNLSYQVELCPRIGDKTVNDAQLNLSPDFETGFEEEVIDPADAALQRIFNGDDTELGVTTFYRIKDCVQCFAGFNINRRTIKINGGFLTVSTNLTLEGNP